MFKAISEFFVTGIAVLVAYVTYAIIAIISTLLIGLPIAIGIKMILDVLTLLFTNTGTLPN
jgi:hypothetical protein